MDRNSNSGVGSGQLSLDKLNQPQRLKTGVAVAADDDVVVQGNAERPGGIDDLFRHIDVGARRRRIAGRVIVNKNNRGRRQFERAFYNLADVDRRVVNSTTALNLVGNEIVFFIQK